MTFYSLNILQEIKDKLDWVGNKIISEKRTEKAKA